MLPGKTYARPGAFVRKPVKPTSKRKPNEANNDNPDGDNGDQLPKDVLRNAQPFKAAVEAARRAAKNAVIPETPSQLYDPATVRERVRNWQSQGGGVVTAPDLAVKPGDSEDEAESGATTKSHPTSPVKDRWGARDEKIATKQNLRNRSASPKKGAYDTLGLDTDLHTPRKRIVSDSHWRQKQVPPPGKKGRVSGEESDNARRDGKPKHKTLLDDGIRVYAMSPASGSTPTQNEECEQEERSGSEDDTLLSPQPLETDSASEEELTPKQARRNEVEQPPVARKDTKRTPRGILGAVLQESKRMFARTEIVYVSQPENPRIDNWLGMIPDLPDDPFISDEKEKEKEREELETAKTTLRRRRKSRATEVTNPDPNGIWDKLSTVDTIAGSAGELHRRQRHRSSRSLSDNIIPTENITTQDEEVRGLNRLEPGVSKSLGKQNNQQEAFATKSGPTSTQPRRNTVGVAALQALFSSNRDGSTKIESDGPQLQSRDQPSQSANTSSSPRKTFAAAERPRLSTIASMDTLNTEITRSSVLSELSADSDFTATPKHRKSRSDLHERSAKDGPRRKKTRLTRHSDLMSVLSVSHNGGKSIRSARSVRTHRTRPGTATIPDLMKDITNEEIRYMQELRTLVDGVIPVLLSSVLSQSESKAVANLFSPLGQTSFVRDATFSMGVALEGLKKWHQRLEPGASGPVSGTVFLTWAQGVHRTYKDYLKAWRMGFQDVVVNLAPAETGNGKDEAFKHGLPRNKDGDVIDSTGERVDVAFLLKRPLVRLKSLAKNLKDINTIQPSTLAEKLATDFQDLVVEARRRVNEEKARLEDEAAANLDITRCRRVDNLAPHPGLTINTTRRVRARDFFDLSLLHSNGQRLDCSVELLLRDDAPGSGNGGDLLICQFDTGDKWLLFPPIDQTCISARNGDSPGEIVVMLRGLDSRGQAWQELLFLVGDDEATAADWVEMLGLVPIPPQMKRSDRSLSKDNTPTIPVNITLCDSMVSESLISGASYSQTSSSPSSLKTQIPLGEHTNKSSQVSSSRVSGSEHSRSASPSRRDTAATISLTNSQTSDRSVSGVEGRSRTGNSSPERAISMDATVTPRTLNEAMRMAGSPNSTLQRNRATKKRPTLISSLSPERNAKEQDQTTSRPTVAALFRQNSSTPSVDLSPIPKARATNQTEDQNEQKAQQANPVNANILSTSQQQRDDQDIPPPPPPHKTSSPIKLSTSPIPDLDPGTVKGKRLSSSPLKHQYEPSSASDDGSDTSSAAAADDDGSGEDSDSSDDEDDFELDEVPELPQQFLPTRRPPTSQPSLPSKTLGPSSSASQAPYKTVPSQPNKALHIAAAVSYWSDMNQWVQLRSNVCSIIVAPGLVEIYEMSSAYLDEPGASFVQPSAPSPAAQPLLILHLTPMVLLQQGTALDVTVRSPAQGGTMMGTFTSVNFLFRSRSPEEAEALYAMFHHSRMNNPTYIALQQARATAEKPGFASVFGRAQGRSSSSWFTFGRQKSYRASSAPAPKAKSDPSIGTQATSFSAKLFGSGRFNVARSSVMSRKSPDGSIFTSSDNSMGSGTSSPLPGVMSGTNETPLGLSNTKIRLYSREGNRWLDLGSANLTIMRPTYVSDNGMDLASPPEVGYAHGIGSNGVITPTQKRSADDKRIVVVKAKKATVLLDITLGESCFERTARTGIALSLWEIFEGGRVADRGGVTNGRFKYFMMQFQNEAACAFTFSMVGRHRYGTNG